MSTVRLSDIVEPAVYTDYQSVNSVEKTAFATSGVVVRTPALDAKANSGGRVVDVPFWKDLANTEPNISSDDPAATAVPEKIATGDQVARIAYLNKTYSEMDLASEVAGSNALARIKDRVESAWSKAFQKRLIAMVGGLKAANIAQNDGDMLFDVANDEISVPTAGQLFTRNNFTSAAFTLGDAFENTGAIAVHSTVYKRMIDNDDIDFIKDSQGSMLVPTFMGRTVIVDDGMPVVAGANRTSYTSVLFGNGAVGFGQGTPEMETEVLRSPLQGNGGGMETLITRKTWLLHAFGYKFTGASVAGVSASNAELAMAANWGRVFDERKQIPIAFLVTNG